MTPRCGRLFYCNIPLPQRESAIISCHNNLICPHCHGRFGWMGFKCNHLASIFNSTTPCEVAPAGPGCISAWIFIVITLCLTCCWLLLSTLAELRSVSGLTIDEPLAPRGRRCGAQPGGSHLPSLHFVLQTREGRGTMGCRRASWGCARLSVRMLTAFFPAVYHTGTTP